MFGDILEARSIGALFVLSSRPKLHQLTAGLKPELGIERRCVAVPVSHRIYTWAIRITIVCIQGEYAQTG